MREASVITEMPVKSSGPGDLLNRLARLTKTSFEAGNKILQEDEYEKLSA